MIQDLSPTENDDVFNAAEALENETNEANEISEASKKGYQLLKENRFDEAVECFAQIPGKRQGKQLRPGGLGDAARKRGSFREGRGSLSALPRVPSGNSYALVRTGRLLQSPHSTTRLLKSGNSIFCTTIRT
jgi:hypothetical protein